MCRQAGVHARRDRSRRRSRPRPRSRRSRCPAGHASRCSRPPAAGASSPPTRSPARTLELVAAARRPARRDRREAAAALEPQQPDRPRRRRDPRHDPRGARARRRATPRSTRSSTSASASSRTRPALMRDGRFYPEHGLERIVDVPRAPGRALRARRPPRSPTRPASRSSPRPSSRSPHPTTPGPRDGARDRTALLPVGEPGGHRARAPLALRPLPAAPRPRLTAPEAHRAAGRRHGPARARRTRVWSSPGVHPSPPPRRRERPTSQPLSTPCGLRASGPAAVRRRASARRSSREHRLASRLLRTTRVSSWTTLANPAAHMASVQRRPRARAGVDARSCSTAAAALAVLGPDHTFTHACASLAKRRQPAVSSVAAIRCSPPPAYEQLDQERSTHGRTDPVTSLAALADAIVASGVRRSRRSSATTRATTASDTSRTGRRVTRTEIGPLGALTVNDGCRSRRAARRRSCAQRRRPPRRPCSPNAASPSAR